MNKIVYNAYYGGFSLSEEAVLLARKLSENSEDWMRVDTKYGYIYDNISRHDKILVAVVEQLGDLASGRCAKLRIFNTNSKRYMIEEYDGFESVRVGYDEDEWTYIS